MKLHNDGLNLNNGLYNVKPGSWLDLHMLEGLYSFQTFNGSRNNVKLALI